MLLAEYTIVKFFLVEHPSSLRFASFSFFKLLTEHWFTWCKDDGPGVSASNVSAIMYHVMMYVWELRNSWSKVKTETFQQIEEVLPGFRDSMSTQTPGLARKMMLDETRPLATRNKASHVGDKLYQVVLYQFYPNPVFITNKTHLFRQLKSLELTASYSQHEILLEWELLTKRIYFYCKRSFSVFPVFLKCIFCCVSMYFIPISS